MPTYPIASAATAVAPPLPSPGRLDNATVHGLISGQAALRPAAPAIRTMDGEELTYAELQHRASAFARRLRSHGVRPGQYVVVRMRRTPALVVALLGVMQAGAAYVAVDRSWPPARVQHIVDTAGAHLLTDAADGAEFPLLPAAGRRHLPSGEPVQAKDASPLPDVDGCKPCTVFFTSGSTGEPKGTVCPHRAVVHRFVDVSYADFGPGRTTLQAAPVCWDAMTIELWSVLMNGGTSLLLSEGHTVTPGLLRGLIRSAGLDTLWLTAALFNALVDDDLGSLDGVSQLLTGGEKLSTSHIRRFRASYPQVRLINGYGPVEATVFATTRDIKDGDADRYCQIPLGTPLPQTSVHVLTPQGTPCSPGETGEICIGGPGLALGYLGDPQLTGDRFVTLASGERVYRSGDLGWWHPDGVLLYGGRQDRQVKIRGQRVEPAELEHFLEQTAGAHRAAVTVIRDSAGSATGLAAHCLTPGGLTPGGLTAEQLGSRCTAQLPPYMRPRQILLHDAFPLTRAGKIDMRALERMAVDARHRPAAFAGEGTQHLSAPLLSCLAEAGHLLGYEPGPDEDLFTLGADSIFAMRLVSRLARRHRIRVALDAVHNGRTPRAIVAHAEPIAEPGQHTPNTEVNDSRIDLWLGEQLAPGDPAHLLVSSFEVRPAVDHRALRAALDVLTARHPALRTGFRLRDAAVYAEPLPDTEIPLHTPPAPAGSDLSRHFPAEWLAPFDLAHDPPVRCFVTPAPGGSTVTLVMHHIAYDGWSEHIFLSELGAAYSAAGTGSEGLPSPPPLPSPTHPPAVTGLERDRVRAHWRRALEGVEPLNLPHSTAGPTAGRLAELRLELPADDVLRLRDAAGSDPHIAALAWYGHALHSLTGTTRFAVGSYFAGRETVDENAIGYFVRPVPVVLDFRDAPPLDVVAAGAHRRWLDAIGQPALPLADLAEFAPRPLDYGLPPIFQAALAFQNAPATELAFPQHEVTRSDVPPPGAPLPLALQIWPRRDGSWDARLQCDPARIDSSVLPGLAAQLTDRLHDLPSHVPANGR